MKFAHAITVGILALAVAGCVTNETTTLRNTSGDTRYCYLHTDNSLAKITAMGEYNKCLNDAGTAGYKKVDSDKTQ